MHTQRELYFEHLKELEKDILEMGELVIIAIKRGFEAFKILDMEESQKIIHDDKNINAKRWDIEEKCINLIATQHPVASDLREIITILNIIIELERMGDYAAGIAKITIMYDSKTHIKPLLDIPRMVEKDIYMINNGLKAFIERNEELAKEIWNMDNEVDCLYEQILRELITYMIEDTKIITKATYVLWVAHNLERIADRVTNICERIVFLIKGKMERMNTNMLQ